MTLEVRLLSTPISMGTDGSVDSFSAVRPDHCACAGQSRTCRQTNGAAFRLDPSDLYVEEQLAGGTRFDLCIMRKIIEGWLLIGPTAGALLLAVAAQLNGLALAKWFAKRA